jgi:hypothetical protein
MGVGSQIKVAAAFVQLSVKGGKELELRLTKAQNAMLKTAQVAVKVGSALAIGGAAVNVGLFKAVKNASDLNEAMNKTVKVFGVASEKVIAFADNSAQKLGISKAAALDFAGQFGLIIEKTGLAKDAVADMSIEMVQRGTDLASIFDRDVADALEKLKSGIVGESKPLREFGVIMDELAVTSRSTADGLDQLKGEFSPSAKLMSRYNIIMEQTESVSGDFADTSNDVANAMRKVGAEATNASAAIGTSLLPDMKKLLASTLSILTLSKEFSDSNPLTVWLAALATQIALVGGVMLLALGLVIGPLAKAFGAISKVFQFLVVNLGYIASGFATVVKWLGSLIAGVGAATTALAVLAGVIATIGLDFLISGEFSLKTLYDYIAGSKERNRLDKELAESNLLNADRRAREAKAEQDAADAARQKIKEKAKEQERLNALIKEGTDAYESELKALLRAEFSLNNSVEALERYDDVAKNISTTQSQILDKIRQSNRATEKSTKDADELKESAKAYKDSIDDRLNALIIENIRIKQGVEAAAQAQDIVDGIGATEARILATKRQINAADQAAVDKAQELSDLADAAAEAAQDKLRSTRESAAAEKRSLELAIIKATLGQQEFERHRDIDKGFVVAERVELANLRAKLAEAEDENEAEKKATKAAMKKTQSDISGGSSGGFFGGAFSQRLGVAASPAADAIQKQSKLQERGRKRSLVLAAIQDGRLEEFRKDQKKFQKRIIRGGP